MIEEQGSSSERAREIHSSMTDHSPKNPFDVLAQAQRHDDWASGLSEGMRWYADYVQRVAESQDRALTPPEGDTLSGDVVEARQAAWQFFDGLDGPLQAAFGALSDDDKSEAVDQLEAALQSRVSPQEGLREALEELRSEVIRGFGLINPESKLGKALTKSDAALSACEAMSRPIPKEDAVTDAMVAAGVKAIQQEARANWNLVPFGLDDATNLARACYAAMSAARLEPRHDD